MQAAPALAPGVVLDVEDKLEIGSDPATPTGEEVTGSDGDATPAPSRAKRPGDKRPRVSASRAETAAKIRAAREQVEAELDRRATQAEVAQKAGCSTATVSRAESGETRLRLAA